MESVLLPSLKQSVMITSFVLFMMVVIEYINVQSRNRWAEQLHRSPFMQILISALLGITPGCLGAFTVVSLYTHRLVGFAGLVTVMIATSGDEAFVMFSLFPGKALILQGILLVIAVGSGWLVHRFAPGKDVASPHGFEVHEEDICHCFSRSSIIPQLKQLSFERTVLLLGIFLFLFLLISGAVGTPGWDWKKITFLAGACFLLFVFLTVPEHFLKEHLYRHVVKKHLLRLFLWTWGAFIALYLIQSNLTLTHLLENNLYMVLLIAVLVGLVPESGPHLIFVTLFSEGLLPFSILLANSIVQDGHGILPLLAESRKDFLKVKAINMGTGLIAGGTFLLAGW
ncbi:MAG: putative manganese transporter [Bacteroidales bacterium]